MNGTGEQLLREFPSKHGQFPVSVTNGDSNVKSVIVSDDSVDMFWLSPQGHHLLGQPRLQPFDCSESWQSQERTINVHTPGGPTVKPVAADMFSNTIDRKADGGGRIGS